MTLGGGGGNWPQHRGFEALSPDQKSWYSWWFRPVQTSGKLTSWGKGSWSHDLQQFDTFNVVVWDFWTRVSLKMIGTCATCKENNSHNDQSNIHRFHVWTVYLQPQFIPHVFIYHGKSTLNLGKQKPTTCIFFGAIDVIMVVMAQNPKTKVRPEPKDYEIKV